MSHPTSRTLVAHCRMRSEGQVRRCLERLRHLAFLKNLLAELDEGIHRHNRRAATHGLLGSRAKDRFARIAGHNPPDGPTGHEAHRLVAYPTYTELTGELTKLRQVLREADPADPLLAIPLPLLRGAVRDYLLCRKQERKRGRRKRLGDARSMCWTELPPLTVDGTRVRIDAGALGTLRARLERPLAPGEEVDQVRLVLRQRGTRRVCPSRFELHLTVSRRAPKPEYVRPPKGRTAEEKAAARARQREARRAAQAAAKAERARAERALAERAATERGRIHAADIGGRATATDDAGNELRPRRRCPDEQRAESRSISRKRRGSKGRQRAAARKAKRNADLARHNRASRKKRAAHTVQECDIVVTDRADLQARCARGGKPKRGMNRSQAEAGAGHYRAELDRQANKQGKLSVRVDPAWTTRQCLQCHGRNTRANATHVRCLDCAAKHPRDQAGAANLALRHIAHVESQTSGGRSSPPAPDATNKTQANCPGSRSWSVRRRSLLPRGSSAESLLPQHDNLVREAMESWGPAQPRKRPKDKSRQEIRSRHQRQEILPP